MSGKFPRSPIIKKNGIRWNTAKSDFPEVQADINHIGDPEGSRQSTSILVWLTPEQIREKQIELFNQRRGNVGKEIYARKNQGHERENVKQIKEAMQRGDTFTPLTFYHDRFGNIEEPQEGAHRTHAIEELGVKKVPVWLHYQKGDIEKRVMKHYPETESKISKYKKYEIGEAPEDIGDYGKLKKKRVKKTQFYGI